jgi:hypothetical protein
VLTAGLPGAVLPAKIVVVTRQSNCHLIVARGFEIRNRYSDMYDASTYAEDFLIGKDDYKYVFRKLSIGDLAYEFVNLKSPYINSDNCIGITKEFIDKVKEEMYRMDI